MAKYAKNDCRNNARRLARPKACSRMRWISIFIGEDRHTRRAIGARFRHFYGMEAFREMKKHANEVGIIAAVRAVIEDNVERFEAIAGRRMA